MGVGIMFFLETTAWHTIANIMAKDIDSCKVIMKSLHDDIINSRTLLQPLDPRTQRAYNYYIDVLDIVDLNND